MDDRSPMNAAGGPDTPQRIRERSIRLRRGNQIPAARAAHASRMAGRRACYPFADVKTVKNCRTPSDASNRHA
ncbi:hypothetical protein DB771_24045 [Burkholderia sp. AU29985]|nr:hypothetical protein XM57_03200 [Burkholderia cepacia]AYZ95531.1 hypothetical protein EGY28_09935 [Burkholderia dolosa]ETP61867.1 hypothetical protein BDSB_29410 [Burkholderia dolosa PC543]PRE50987.1 hypothetical protein C6P87_10850 [Burkholderia sp. AU12872]PUA74375.1 hypothetical protein DB771_24045 [Burkholderia sp. AU29985]